MSWACPGCEEAIDEEFDACWKCGTDRDGNAPAADGWEEATADLPVDAPPLLPMTTTPGFEDRSLVEYVGIVAGEAIVGANVFADAAAGVRDVVGGRSRSYERKLGQARAHALADLSAAARNVGADAVVGVSIGFETLRGSMLIIMATGTAVATAPVGSLPAQ